MIRCYFSAHHLTLLDISMLFIRICFVIDSRERKLKGETNPPDLVYGGPPCQSFSQAGKQKGVTDERGQLLFEFLRFVKALQPTFFVMENVSNLKGLEKGALYTEIINKIQDMNYNISVETLLAADFGAPQLRQRIVFLGCRNNVGSLSLPIPTHRENRTLFDQPYMTVEEAFQGLPEAQYNAERKKSLNRKLYHKFTDNLSPSYLQETLI
jgi:DNA (cytosine-5)-methyltransferase 1